MLYTTTATSHPWTIISSLGCSCFRTRSRWSSSPQCEGLQPRHPHTPVTLEIRPHHYGCGSKSKRMQNVCWIRYRRRSVLETRYGARYELRTPPKRRLLQMPVSNFEARRSSTFCAEKGSTQTQPSAIHRNTVMQDEEGCRLRKFVTIRTVCSFRPRMFCVTHRDCLGATHVKTAVAIYQRSGIRNQYRRVFPVHFSYI